MLTRPRSLVLRAESIDEESRTVRATIATEAPVRVFDFDEGQIDEVLLMSGVELPDQVSLLDSHDRSTVAAVLGSIRNFDKESTVVDGDETFKSLDASISFSTTREGDSAFTKTKEKHLRDMSIGYSVKTRRNIKRGEKETIDGREFTGPVSVVTRWSLKEGSVTAVGADHRTKLRKHPESTKGITMDKALRAALESKGMDSAFNDQEAIEWLSENRAEVFKGDKKDPPSTPPKNTPAEDGDSDAKLRLFVKEENKRQKDIATDFRRDVAALANLAGVDVQPEWNELDSLADAQAAVAEAKKELRGDPLSTGFVRFSDSQPQERGIDAMRYALLSKTLTTLTRDADLIEKQIDDCPWGGANVQSSDRKGHLQKAKEAARDYRYLSMMELAERCLVIDGVDVRGASKSQKAQAALGFVRQSNLQRRDGYAALHTTGSFTVLTADAVNKSMQIGAAEFPATWKGPMRQGSSVPDFKTIHRIRHGSIPNLPVWVDNKDPEQAKFADAEETYAVEARSLDISFSWQLLVNDDMDALSRAPQMAGAAAARTVNAVAWGQVTANPVMGADSEVLFLATPANLRFRANLIAASGAPTVLNVQALGNLMRLMRGENTPEGAESADILGLIPRYLVGPSALETQIRQLVESSADPAAGHAAVSNPANTLIPVIEPLLDANSATAWYLFADTSMIDTVEVTFLEGQENPIIRTWETPQTMALHHTVLQTFAAKPLNHRGVARHDGV